MIPYPAPPDVETIAMGPAYSALGRVNLERCWMDDQDDKWEQCSNAPLYQDLGLCGPHIEELRSE